MQLPSTVELKGIRVLTSKQLAECYESTPVRIKQNFNENRNRFVDGKHYISLTGDELKAFKKQVGNSYLVANRTSHLYLWTEKGALLHAKSLNTDKAWEVYDYLVDFYFRAKEERKVPVTVETKPELLKNNFKIPVMEEPVFIFKNLLAIAEENDITLRLKDMSGYFSVLNGKRIVVRKNLEFEKVVYELAYELAHYFIHYNQGNMINSPLSKDYNEQAEKAACMIIRLLDIKVKQAY